MRSPKFHTKVGKRENAPILGSELMDKAAATKAAGCAIVFWLEGKVRRHRASDGQSTTRSVDWGRRK